MADIRISALPNETTPSGSDFVPIDLVSTRKTTVTLLTEAGRPAASQAEAEAGTNPTKAMTPLTTKQAITFQVGAISQPLDADLTAIAALATTGIATRTAANTWTTRTVTGTANQIGVTNGDGVAGNPTLSLLGNVLSLSGLSLSAGDLLYSTGVGTVSRLPLGSTNQILQVIAGNPTWQNVAGTGDVVGPASSVTLTIPTFSGTTGKILLAGNPALADLLAASRGVKPTITNDVTDATNDIVFSAGSSFSTDATNWPMVAAAQRIKQLDATWAVGTNAGGRMSAAAIADTTYYCYQIRRPDTGVVDFGFDVSATAPTLPTNYTQYRLIGAIVRQAGVIRQFLQDGNKFYWKTPAADHAAINPGTSAVTRTLTVPIGLRVRALINVGYSATAAGDCPGACYVSDLSLTDIAPTAAAGTSMSFAGTATGTYSGSAPTTVMTNTSGQVRSRIQISTAGTTLFIVTNGFEIIDL